MCVCVFFSGRDCWLSSSVFFCLLISCPSFVIRVFLFATPYTNCTVDGVTVVVGKKCTSWNYERTTCCLVSYGLLGLPGPIGGRLDTLRGTPSPICEYCIAYFPGCDVCCPSYFLVAERPDGDHIMLVS